MDAIKSLDLPIWVQTLYLGVALIGIALAYLTGRRTAHRTSRHQTAPPTGDLSRHASKKFWRWCAAR